MPTRYLEVVKPKTRFAVWAWSPIIVLRIALFLTYAFCVYGAIVAFIAGVPIFTLTTLPGYTPIWAVILGASAVASAIGAISDRWQRLERWASLVLSAMLLGYVGGMNIRALLEQDLSRQFAGAIAIIAMILPATRFIYLAAQSGKKRSEHDSTGG